MRLTGMAYAAVMYAGLRGLRAWICDALTWNFRCRLAWLESLVRPCNRSQTCVRRHLGMCIVGWASCARVCRCASMIRWSGTEGAAEADSWAKCMSSTSTRWNGLWLQVNARAYAPQTAQNMHTFMWLQRASRTFAPRNSTLKGILHVVFHTYIDQTVNHKEPVVNYAQRWWHMYVCVCVCVYIYIYV